MSSSTWDLRGKQVRVQVADTGGPQMDTFMTLTRDHDNWRRIISWQYCYEYAAPEWLDSAFVELQAGTLGAVSEPGMARFLSFTVEPSTPGQEPSGFSDNFATFARDEQRWLITRLSAGGGGEGSAAVTQGGGTLNIRPPARSKRPLTDAPSTFVDDPNYSGYVSRDAASFVHVAATVEVAQTCGGRRGVTIFGVGADENNWIRFRKAGALLIFELANSGDTSAEQIGYDATAHRWWRLSHTPGNLSYETSSDGTTWATQLSVPQPAWIDNALIELQAGSETSDETEHLNQATFSSFSLAHI